MSRRTGSVLTVEGPIEPDELGVTITHEHAFIDVSNWTAEPKSAYEQNLHDQEVSIENLGYLNRHPVSNKHNTSLDSLEGAIEEISRYHRAGGDTIVDVTPKNVGGDPGFVRQVSRATGVQFIHGTAYYVRDAHPARIAELSVDELTDEFVSDVEDGIGESSIPAGIIGEIGVSVDENAEIHDEELKVLRAAARAARETGAPLSVHPPGRTEISWKDYTYPTSRWALDLLDVIEAEGLAPERCIMCHMDRTNWEELVYQKRIAERGAYLEYDLWGNELDMLELGPMNGYPKDATRARWVAELIDEGWVSNLLFSHDVDLKNRLARYGGDGYTTILETAIPRLRHLGVSREAIDTILRTNPREVLTFDDPS